MKTYSEKLKDPRWQRKRLEIMNRDGFRCRMCGNDSNTLHVHHIRYDRGAEPWDYPDSSLVTVCADCHEDFSLSKFGESIVEAAIVGGADMHALYGLMYAFQAQFQDGPNAAPIQTVRWEDVVGAVTYALMAVARGATERDVRTALAPLLEESG